MNALARTDLEFVAEGDAPSAAPATAVISRIDAETVVRGHLKADGVLEIAGKVEGEIDAKTLIIAAGGRVTGDIRADAMTVAGAYTGTVRCKSLTLRDTATVKGEIHYERVAIESGADVEAAFHKEDQPDAIAAE